MTNEQLSIIERDFSEKPVIKLMNESKFECDKAHTLCFSGHRPENLPKGRDTENIIKSYIALEIKNALNDGYHTFIMGGSRGIDLWAGITVVREKLDSPGIKLVAALPYFSQVSRFSEHERFDYGYVLDACSDVLYASNEYTKDCMKRRNIFMTEHSSRIVAFVRDYRSGTGQTIRLAEKAGLETRIYDINTIFKKRPLT
jgi:uncharacterized phage-like protein YoqJ